LSAFPPKLYFYVEFCEKRPPKLYLHIEFWGPNSFSGAHFAKFMHLPVEFCPETATYRCTNRKTPVASVPRSPGGDSGSPNLQWRKWTGTAVPFFASFLFAQEAIQTGPPCSRFSCQPSLIYGSCRSQSGHASFAEKNSSCGLTSQDLRIVVGPVASRRTKSLRLNHPRTMPSARLKQR
jgi:hypothetical protein